MDDLLKLFNASRENGFISFEMKNGKPILKAQCNHIVAMQGICEMVHTVANTIPSDCARYAFLSTIKEDVERLIEGGGREKKMGYRTCPYCGAHLDPGEKCDCQEEEDEDEDRCDKGAACKELCGNTETDQGAGDRFGTCR